MSISLSDYENGFYSSGCQLRMFEICGAQNLWLLAENVKCSLFGDLSFLTEASPKKLGSLVLGLKLLCRGKSKKTQKTKSNAKLNAKSNAKPNAKSNEKSKAESNAKSKTYSNQAEPHTPIG